MATPSEIEQQVQFERDAIASGLKKLRDQTEKLEKQSYASATIYGVASIDTMLPLVVEQIEETRERIKRGHNGQTFSHIATYLSELEPLALAAIACKVVFDRVFSYDEKGNYLVSVQEYIGRSVEQECQMRHYERVAPGLLNTIIKNYSHKSQGTQQKFVVVRTPVSYTHLRAHET